MRDIPSHLPTKPLKVTAYLADDKITIQNDIVMFDAVLYEAWFRKNGLKMDEKGGVKFVGLPLRQFNGNRWAASRGIIGNSKIEFYCMGTKNKIQDLLSYIITDRTLGIVDGWYVEDIEDDYSLIHPKYGLMRPVPVIEAVALKNKVNLDQYPCRMFGVKPPYWKEVNKRLCYVPIVSETPGDCC